AAYPVRWPMVETEVHMAGSTAGPRSFGAPQWVLELSDDYLESLFGAVTLHRGRDYQERGAVDHLTVRADGIMSATVHGTYPYRTSISWDPYDDESMQVEDIITDCTCPVAVDCKHAAATILHAQVITPPNGPWTAQRPTSTPPARAVPTWETLLAPVAAEVDPPPSDPATVPLALHLDASRNTSRYGGGAFRLRMRPLMRGASGAWIKTGISWSELQHGYPSRRIDPAQRGAMAALLQAHRARTSQWYGIAEV